MAKLFNGIDHGIAPNTRLTERAIQAIACSWPLPVEIVLRLLLRLLRRFVSICWLLSHLRFTRLYIFLRLRWCRTVVASEIDQLATSDIPAVWYLFLISARLLTHDLASYLRSCGRAVFFYLHFVVFLLQEYCRVCWNRTEKQIASSHQ